MILIGPRVGIISHRQTLLAHVPLTYADISALNLQNHPNTTGQGACGIISASVRPRYRYTLRTLRAPGAFVPTPCSAQAWRTQAKFWFWPNSKFFQVYNHNMVNCFNFIFCSVQVLLCNFYIPQSSSRSCPVLYVLCLVGLHEYTNHGVLVPALPKLNNWPLCALQCRGLSS